MITGIITYLYWGLVFLLAVAALVYIGGKLQRWKTGFIMTAVILLMGLSVYFFYFRQLFVQQYGGIMTIDIPSGQHHMGVNWKNDNLWVENYDPETNTCYYREYSRGHILQGEVTIQNCNPLMPSKLLKPSL